MLVIHHAENLDKAKALPEGTRRKYGTNWFKKIGGQWVYDGRADIKRKGTGPGQRSKVVQAAKDKVKADEGLAPLSAAEFASEKKKFTKKDRISEGQEVTYVGAYHPHLTGQNGKLVAIGRKGFAMVKYPDGTVESSAWSDIRPIGKIAPHSLYDKVDPQNTYRITGELQKKMNQIMKQKIGNSNWTYEQLAIDFRRRGFNLQIVGGTVRDLLDKSKKVSDIKDVDFIFNGTDRELTHIINDINPAWLQNATVNSHLGLCSFTDGGDVVDITPVHKYSKEMGDMAKGWNLDDDAKSRDFAMNSLQLNPLTGIVVDSTGTGIQDIKDKKLTFCDPSVLKTAPRYVLRALKFIGRGYALSGTSEGVLKKSLKYTSTISPTRRETFIRRQIGEKDGINGLDAFKAAFKKYDAALWNREYEYHWRNVYKQMGGRLSKAAKTEFQRLKDNKIPLTDEERAEVMKKKAVWSFGINGADSPAVWKAKDGSGKLWFISNTHRAWQKRPTLKGAIKIFHDFIQGTA